MCLANIDTCVSQISTHGSRYRRQTRLASIDTRVSIASTHASHKLTYVLVVFNEYREQKLIKS